MTDPEREPARSSEVRYDDWPVDDTAAYGDWDVHRTSPVDEDDTAAVSAPETGTADDEIVWIGIPDADGSTGPILYAPADGVLYEGELDEENEAVRLESVHREGVGENSLGEHVEAVADEHGWTWLSAYAREHVLEDDREANLEGPFVEHRGSEFQRRNVTDADAYDLAFVGSHTFVDESGRVHVVERQFLAFLDDAADAATIAVEEEHRVATEPAADRRAGDSELVAEEERELVGEVDPEGASVQDQLATELEEWHAERVGWPESSDATGSADGA